MRLEKELKIQQSNLSKHLERLANVGIIVSRRESQFIYYTVNVDILKEYPFIKEIIDNELDKEMVEHSLSNK